MKYSFRSIRLCLCDYKLNRFGAWCVRVCVCVSGDAVMPFRNKKWSDTKSKCQKWHIRQTMTTLLSMNIVPLGYCQETNAAQLQNEKQKKEMDWILYPSVCLCVCVRRLCGLDVSKLTKSERFTRRQTIFAFDQFLLNLIPSSWTTQPHPKQWLNCRRNVSQLYSSCNVYCYLSIW